MNDSDKVDYLIRKRRESLSLIAGQEFNVIYFVLCLVGGFVASWLLRAALDQSYVGPNLPWVIIALILGCLLARAVSKHLRSGQINMMNNHNNTVEANSLNYNSEELERFMIRESDFI